MSIKLRMEHDGKDVWELQTDVRYAGSVGFPEVKVDKMFEEARFQLGIWREIAKIRYGAKQTDPAGLRKDIREEMEEKNEN